MFTRLFIVILVVKLCQSQIVPPYIEGIQRIRLNAYKVIWNVPNAMNYQLTRSRVTLFDGGSSIEWPSQAVKVNKDGDDAKDLGTLTVSSYLECVKYCLANPQCNFIVKSNQRCFLKASTPTTSTCAPSDECAAVLGYSNEANLFDLPMNKTFRLTVQVYDAKSSNWSAPSQLSETFSTFYLKPQMTNIIEPLGNNTMRISWSVPDPTIINPTRYSLQVFRFSTGDLKFWPAQMTPSDTDGPAIEYNRFSRSMKSDFECKSECIKDKRCLLAVRDQKFCYLKNFPTSPGPCGYANGCWRPKSYTSYADLYHLPFDDTYKFQVSIYDTYSDTWSLLSDFSTEFNLKIKMDLNVVQLDDFSYKLQFAQVETAYPVVRYKVLVTKNGSAYYYDTRLENNLRASTLSTGAPGFNNDIAVNQGYVGTLFDCIKYCANTSSCVGVKFRSNNCYTTYKFDPFNDEECRFDGDQCYSIYNNAQEVILDNVDASTTYTVQIQYFTRYNTTGFSNTVTFNTTRINVAVQSGVLIERNPGVLTCITSNSSIVSQILWEKDDIILDKFQQNINIDDQQRTLTFTNLSHFFDNGKYACLARLSTNNQLLRSEPFYVFVKYGPFYQDLYANTSLFRYNITDTAQFKCSAEGYGPFQFGWKYSNGSFVTDIATTTFSNQTFKYYSEMFFKNFSREYNGTYMCVVDSTVISKVNIFVYASPSKPYSISLRSLNESTVSVSGRLENNGNYPITGIIISWYPGSIPKQAMSTTILTMGNYFNASIYNAVIPDGSAVTITLVNSLGNSSPSDIVKYTIIAVAPSQGMSTQTLIIAIAVPVAVLIIIGIIVIVWLRKRRVKITKI